MDEIDFDDHFFRDGVLELSHNRVAIVVSSHLGGEEGARFSSCNFI